MIDMLDFFVSYLPKNQDVLKVCQYLNAIKKGIQVADYSIHYDTKDLFKNILEYAKRIDIESN